MWKLVVFRKAGGHCGIHEGGGYASSAVRADRDGDMIPGRLQRVEIAMFMHAAYTQYMRKCVCVAFKVSCVSLVFSWFRVTALFDTEVI